MRVLLIDSLFEHEIRTLGHDVLSLHPNGRLINLPILLSKKEFIPDVIIQQEALGPRTFITGLHEFDCPKLFWAIDSHLNMFWHRWYAQQFDAVATPHISIWQNQHNPTPPALLRFAWPGTDRKWIPHTQRKQHGIFIGRLSEHRQLRTWMVKLLQSFTDIQARDNVPYTTMLALYSDTKIVPNESIAGEVNFRLPEALSCGCLLLSPDIGSDQNTQYEPGKEFIPYRDGLELLELARYYTAHPKEAEGIAYAGWERTQREHLPIHRARTLLAWAEAAQQQKKVVIETESAQYTVFAELVRDGRLAHSSASAEFSLEAPPANSLPHAQAVHLRLMAETRAADIRPHCLTLLQRPPGNKRLIGAAALSALHLGDIDLAKALTFHAITAEQQRPQTPPVTPEQIYGFWADIFVHSGELTRQGFSFTPGHHVPACAYEAILMAQQHTENMPYWEKRMRALLQKAPFGFHIQRMKLTALASLKDAANWRTQQDYGVLSLQAFRVTEGLAELTDAYAKATAQGQSKSFITRLGQIAPGDHILRMLDQETPDPFTTAHG